MVEFDIFYFVYFHVCLVLPSTNLHLNKMKKYFSQIRRIPAVVGLLEARGKLWDSLHAIKSTIVSPAFLEGWHDGVIGFELVDNALALLLGQLNQDGFGMVAGGCCCSNDNHADQKQDNRLHFEMIVLKTEDYFERNQIKLLKIQRFVSTCFVLKEINLYIDVGKKILYLLVWSTLSLNFGQVLTPSRFLVLWF